MKQNIKLEQFNELSEKGKKKLIKWRDDKRYFHFEADNISGEGYGSTIDDPLLSIGQLIEFLDENEAITKHGTVGKKGVIANGEVIYWNGELADELWEKCKEVLEK